MSTRVASRYAKSLLDLSIDQKIVDKVNTDMETITTIVNESKEMENLLASPIIDGKKKAAIFNTLFDKKMEKVSVDFIQLIAQNGREGLLLKIAESFIAQFKEHKGIVDVYITSAQKLDAATRDKILAKVKSIAGGTLVAHEAVDPKLVGGFIVRINDKELDASISSQFRNLKHILLN